MKNNDERINVKIFDGALDYIKLLSEKLKARAPELEWSVEDIVTGLLAEGSTPVGNPYRTISCAVGGKYLTYAIKFLEERQKLYLPIPSKGEVKEIPLPAKCVNYCEEYMKLTGLDQDTMATILLNRTLYRDAPNFYKGTEYITLPDEVNKIIEPLTSPPRKELDTAMDPISEILKIPREKVYEILLKMEDYDKKEAKEFFAMEGIY